MVYMYFFRLLLSALINCRIFSSTAHRGLTAVSRVVGSETPNSTHVLYAALSKTLARGSTRGVARKIKGGTKGKIDQVAWVISWPTDSCCLTRGKHCRLRSNSFLGVVRNVVKKKKGRKDAEERKKKKECSRYVRIS
ncbi:hypothetical protein M441DRAFT_449974 [Trichoderma asperellum CBS 433.97]|uniref:Secreted protein n=1 Tax=Trichoderma asperellum (strain ATCC 204424 / CBS 433.97 / NBRC 101777) TaxID=1042311 RepID=A0A2T3YTV2_TRIA4|nr:hypothetical protein M441DRAFT_449974 [Trichoderma asperellum CBS 433.97]PTB35944.1 hypothetical protein M441DRAFT_449974 [Trichoderma asperellum CBS 433.97]